MSRRFRLTLVGVLLVAPACAFSGAGTGSGGVGAVSCGFGIPGASQPLDIQLVAAGENPSAATLRVRNISRGDLSALQNESRSADDWPRLLRVTVLTDDPASDAASRPAVAGDYAIADDAIVFTPMFGFDRGRRYRVEFDAGQLPSARGDGVANVTTTEVSLPKAVVEPTTTVSHVYPSRSVVPENQLRLYIHFSAPMGLRGGLDYIKLLDDHGVEVKDPFLPLDTEFWNGDRTRFTVFFDPGRVKRGILPNKEMGRSLTEGRPYTLVVSREWRDGEGLPLKEDFRRVFKVGPPDEQPLDQRNWRIDPPRAGTLDPLTVIFPEPLDQGLLLRALGVSNDTGGSLNGAIGIDPGETRWTFTPRQPWNAGGYTIKVLTILEDLAGNRIGRPFEVDQFERADRSAEPEEITIPFRVSM
jgi:hypothetical protein